MRNNGTIPSQLLSISALIEKWEVLQTISPSDGMYLDNADHYFTVGKGAMRNVLASMVACDKRPDSVRRILDLPCGYGRVLRWLRAGFPDAEITACDILADGVDFCAENFGARPVYSVGEPRNIPIRETFDLIWVGSLFTHLNARLWREFFARYDEWLSPGGLLIFTTHGPQVERWASEGRDYGIAQPVMKKMLRDLRRKGFGYRGYAAQKDYGISLSRPHWVMDEIRRLPNLRIAYYGETAWDNHHDVFACQKMG